MKKITALFSFFILTLVVPAGFGLALARAPFPSASRLQPIPVFTHPNVSGNVNSSNNTDTTVISPVEDNNASNVETDVQQAQDAVSPPQDPTPPAVPFSINPVTVLLIVSPTVLIIAGALALKKRADKNNLI